MKKKINNKRYELSKENMKKTIKTNVDTLSEADIIKIDSIIIKQEKEFRDNYMHLLNEYEKQYASEKRKINKYFENNEAVDDILSRSFLYLLKAKLGL